MPGLLRDQVDQGEDDDPDDVDEVPVEAADLDLERVPRVEPSPHRQPPHGQEPDDAARDVRAVEPGEHEEGGSEEIRLERQAQVHEVRELEDLEAHETRPEHGRHEQPDLAPLHVVALHGGQGQHHEQRGHEEHEGADRRQRDIQDLVRPGAADTLALVGQVGPDERAEEHALGAQEGPHAHLAMVETRDADVRVVRGGGVLGGHQWWPPATASAPALRWYSSMNLAMQKSVRKPPRTTW